MLPSHITRIDHSAFSNNNIYKVRSEATNVHSDAFNGQSLTSRLDVSHTPFEAINYINDSEIAIKELTKLANAYLVVDGQNISLREYIKVSSIRDKNTGQSIALDNSDMSIVPGNYDITFIVDMQKLDYQPASLQRHPGIVKSTTLYGYNVPRDSLADNQKYFPYANLIRKAFGTAVTLQDVQDAVKGLPNNFPVTDGQRFVILTQTLPDGQTSGKNPDIQVKVVYDDNTESGIITVPVMIGDAPIPEYEQYNPSGTQLIKKYGETITPEEIFSKIFGLPSGFPTTQLAIAGNMPNSEQSGQYIVPVTVNYSDGKGTDTVNVTVIVQPPKTTILDIDSVTFGYGENITAEELKKYAAAIISDANNNIVDDSANIVVDMSGVVPDAKTGKVEPGNYTVRYSYKRVGYETKTVESTIRVIRNATSEDIKNIIYGTIAPDNAQGKA